MQSNMRTALFGSEKSPSLTKDAIANLLKVSPEQLAAFERAYQTCALTQQPEDFFQQNSRQAAKQKHLADLDDLNESADTEQLQSRIVDALLAQTQMYFYNGMAAASTSCKALHGNATPVTAAEIQRLPVAMQPQLAGNLMKRDIDINSASILLWYYQAYLNAPSAKKKQTMYHMFRQGLDILDLDGITYEIIGTNPNSIGYWLPHLVDACRGQDFFQIPKTAIAKVPLPLLQLTRQAYQSLTPTTLAIVDTWAYHAFQLNESKEYFIKTGTYASKFDFRNAHVKGAKEVKELGEYLLYIHFQALQMASPLCTPCIYGVSTTNEWVVREWIPDKENNPCIYKGLPLHTEYRVFVDCDTKEILGCTPYWEPETMKQRFGHGSDANSPHQIHDYVIYKAHEEKLMQRYADNSQSILFHIQNDVLPNLNLKGQWSLDIMQNGDDFWLIDMALAETSAFYEDCVPAKLRTPTPENWLPEIAEISKDNRE